MNRLFSSRVRLKRTFAIFALAVSFVFGYCVLANQAADDLQMKESSVAIEGGSRTPTGSAAQMIHIDPETGKIVTSPARGRMLEADELGFYANTSHDGLVKVLSPVPGGGVLIDLQGRFRDFRVATISPDGNHTVQHARNMLNNKEKE